VTERAGTSSVTTIQYRVIVGKKDEIVDGPDDADVVITVALADVLADGFDPTVAFMQGKLKSTGSTGALFDLLRSGAAATALSRIASRP
jgi:putative sterol carrier protein